MNAAEKRIEDQDGLEDEKGSPESTTDEEERLRTQLPLLDYASLRAGLDMLPHRAEEVAEKFGLSTPSALRHELRAWTYRLTKDPREARELPAMKSRMEDFWRRYARAGATTPAPAPEPVPRSAQRFDESEPPMVTLPPPARPHLVAAPTPGFNPRSRVVPRARPIAMTVEDVVPIEPAISLERYALLCFAAAHLPDRAEDLFAELRLADPARRREVDVQWQARLRDDVGAYGRWCMYLGRLQALHGVGP